MRLGVGALALGVLAAALTGCATTPTRSATAEAQRPAPEGPRERSLPPRPEPGVALTALSGWAQDDHAAALVAYQQACHLNGEQAALCSEARAFVRPSGETARAFFEARFRAVEVAGGPALLTGYFAPEYQARERPDAEFSAPVRPRPRDLSGGGAYPDRAAIDRRPAGDALAWMRPEELFFLQIQGSGTLSFPDGRSRRAAFAAHNGQGFVGVARPMVQQGLLEDGRASAEAIRTWLADNRGPRAEAIMRLNPRYVFFALEADDGGHPRGAADLPLPPGRAVAVDPAAHRYGEMLWLDAEAPRLAGAFPTYRRLVAALDTGGAIRGPVRADLYTGRGAEAGREAGRIRHTLKVWRLVPRAP